MAAGRPAGEKVEIELTANVWTDASADDETLTIRRGRTSEFSPPTVGEMTGLQLKNTNGQWSPLSQVLVDGTPNTNYPNIVPRKRIRYSNTPAGVRGIGYIKGWPPFTDADGTKWVSITATDRLDRLSRVTLKSPIEQEIAQDPTVAAYPLTDAVGSTTAASGVNNLPAMTLTGTGSAVVFGDNGPGVGDGTGAKFAAGQYLAAPIGAWKARNSVPNAFTYEIWVNTTTVPGVGAKMAALSDELGQVEMYVDHSGFAVFFDDFGIYQGTSRVNDGAWHHLCATYTKAAGLGNRKLYVDGVLQYTNSALAANGSVLYSTLRLGTPWPASVDSAGVGFTGNLGRFAAYDVELSATRIAAHAAATTGYSGDTSGQRIARWLAAGGLTSADWNLDTGKAIVGSYPQAGKDVVSACQDMATTEGGGAVFYVGADGKARFADRTYRKPGAPVMTIDAEADLDATSYAPSYDELTLITQCTASRAAASGTLTTQTYAPTTTLEVTTDQVTSYATTDQDVLNLAQSRVAANITPGFRLPQVAVDLVHAQNNLYASLANVQIGSRIRVTNLPLTVAPATQVDLIVEGWTETIGPDTYRVVFDTSPADIPARGVWDDTSYGRWQCSGQTLSSSITNSGTTIVIATTAGLPTFTTVGARYPLKIQIGQEVITLNTAPGGAASPQTFTGVTRGVNGTTAAAQTAGSTIALAPAATWAL